MWHCNDCDKNLGDIITVAQHRIETGHQDIDRIW